MRLGWPFVLLGTLALFLLPQAQTQAAGPAGAMGEVRPKRLRLPFPQKSEVTQFLAADRKGRLFALRGDTLEVYRLRAEGEPDAIGKLACRPAREAAYAAAMDLSASAWAVGRIDSGVTMCDFHKEKRPTGLDGMVSSVAFSGTGPLVAVVPIGDSRPDLARPISPRVPRVFALDGERWKPVSWAPLPEIDDPSIGVMSQVKAQTDCLLCSGAKGSIWLASWNSYRLQEASDSEKPKSELVVGSPKVTWVERTEEERKDLEAGLKKRGLDPARNRAPQASPQNVIRALLCGRDGSIYLFITVGEGIALDRFHPVHRTLERVMLDGVKVGGGPMTAAFGSDELVFGGRFTEDGLWQISLAELAEASWKPVAGARLNDKAIQ